MRARVLDGGHLATQVASVAPRGRGATLSLSAADGELRVVSREPGRHLMAWGAAEVLVPGQVDVDAAALRALLDGAGPATVSLALRDDDPEDQRLDVVVGGDLGCLRGGLVVDVPTPTAVGPGPDAEWVTHGRLPASALVSIVQAVYAVADVHGLYDVLAGVHLVSRLGFLTAEASDRYRFASAIEDWTPEPGAPTGVDVVVPAADLAVATGHLWAPGDVDAVLSTTEAAGGRWLRIETTSFRADLRVDEHAYPKIPTQPTAVASSVVDTSDLAQLLRQLRALSSTTAITVGEDAIRLHAEGAAGDARRRLPGPRRGVDAEPVAVDIDNLAATVETYVDLGETTVRVSVAGPAQPVTVSPSGDDPRSAIVVASIRTGPRR